MRKKYFIEDMRKIARKRGGECLSNDYINSNTKLKWKCKEGHKWEAPPGRIMNNHWCPICANKLKGAYHKLNIELMKQIAKKKGGKCLSEIYVNTDTKLEWVCAEGHIFKMQPNHVKSGNWCPKCAYQELGDSKRSNIDEMKKIAIKRGGECLSKEYINSQTKLRWRCKEGHEWEAKPNNILSGKWCPFCIGRNKTIEDMKDYAEKKGGECLSKEYIDSNTKLKWKCKESHIWKARPNSIFQGHWCPVCSKGISERICRRIFEELFQKPFPSKKPKWLINPETGRRLELDGYNEELNLAFEYQGPQHYKEFVNYFHSKIQWSKQQNRDQVKKEMCKERGITLLYVPYFILYDDLSNYIIKKCKDNGFNFQSISLNIYDYTTLEGIYSSEKLKLCQEYATQKNGYCLSKVFLSGRTQMLWECEFGHTWKATWTSVRRGTWCPICGGSQRLTIEEMEKIAEEKGGKCLSDQYINNNTKLRWRCKEGHEWDSTPANIKRGRWCPICARGLKHIHTHKGKTLSQELKEKSLELMKSIALEKNGECLSEEYINNHSKLKWKCSKGHVWEASPGNIKAGKWCPFCIGRHKTIEDMRLLAKIREGECLSEEYVKANTKLKWRCSEGHEWEAVPSSIAQGSWCKICGLKNAGQYCKLTIEDMKVTARKKEGECLSDVYVNANSKLRWRCKEGHEWEATPGSIRAGKWCPICARSKRKREKLKSLDDC